MSSPDGNIVSTLLSAVTAIGVLSFVLQSTSVIFDTVLPSGTTFLDREPNPGPSNNLLEKIGTSDAGLTYETGSQTIGGTILLGETYFTNTSFLAQIARDTDADGEMPTGGSCEVEFNRILEVSAEAPTYDGYIVTHRYQNEMMKFPPIYMSNAPRDCQEGERIFIKWSLLVGMTTLDKVKMPENSFNKKLKGHLPDSETNPAYLDYLEDIRAFNRANNLN